MAHLVTLSAAKGLWMGAVDRPEPNYTLTGMFTSFEPSSHNCRWSDSSYEIGADRMGMLFAKYLPVTPSTSGEAAR